MKVFFAILLSTTIGCGTLADPIEKTPTVERVGGGPNEPADYLPVVERAFRSKATADRRPADRGTGDFPWKEGGSEGWDGGECRRTRWTLQKDPAAPLSPPDVFRAEYPAQTVTPRTSYSPGPVTTQAFQNPVHGKRALKELYCQFAFRLGPNYQFNAAGNKLVFFRQTEVRSGVRGEPLIGLKKAPGDHVTLCWNLQGAEDNARKISAVDDSNIIARDQWYILEVQLVLNSAAGTRDGLLKTWIRKPGDKPVLIFDKRDILMRNANDSDASEVWSTVRFDPVFGGQGGTIDPDFFLFLDHCWVSGK